MLLMHISLKRLRDSWTECDIAFTLKISQLSLVNFLQKLTDTRNGLNMQGGVKSQKVHSVTHILPS